MVIFDQAQALEAQGRDVIHLEFGEPDFATPAVIRQAADEALRANRTHYTSTKGLLELREAIAARYQERHHLDIDPEQILVSNGTSLLLQIALLALLSPGDEVLLLDPGYACYENGVRIAGGQPVYVPLREANGFLPEMKALQAAITPRTRALMLSSPSNPTGVIIPRPLLRALAELPLTIISDEIYHGLSYEEEAETLLALSRKDLILGGFSKYFAMTGWRLGYLIAPPELMPTLSVLHQTMMISANEFVQWAGLAALRYAEDDCRPMIEAYAKRRKILVEGLKNIGLGLGYHPTGAFYVFVNIKRYSQDSLAFCQRLLQETGVAVTPGIDFGPGGEGYLRISYANAAEQITEALERLRRFLRNYPT